FPGLQIQQPEVLPRFRPLHIDECCPTRQKTVTAAIDIEIDANGREIDMRATRTHGCEGLFVCDRRARVNDHGSVGRPNRVESLTVDEPNSWAAADGDSEQSVTASIIAANGNPLGVR